MKGLFALLFVICNFYVYCQVDTLSLKYYNKSFLYAEKGEISNALTFINKALAIDSLNNNYLMQKAIILSSNKQYNDAINILDKISDIGKETDDSIILKSLVLEEKGEIEESLALLMDYCDTYSNKKVCKQLALNFFEYDGYEKSVHYYLKAIKIDPYDDSLRIDLSRIVYSLGKELADNEIKIEALNILKEGVKLHNSNILKFYIAKYYSEEEEFSKAIELLNELIEVDPKPLFIEYRAETYKKNKLLKESNDDYVALLKKDSCNTGYYSKILDYYFTNHDYQKVISTSFSAIDCNSINKEVFIESIFTSYFFLQDDLNGEKYLNEAINDFKINSFNIFYIKALILIKKNDLDSSLLYLNKALGLAHNDEEIDIVKQVLSYISFLKKDYAKFVEIYNKLIKSNAVMRDKISLTKQPSSVLNSKIKIRFDNLTGVINTRLIVSYNDYIMLKNKFDIEW